MTDAEATRAGIDLLFQAAEPVAVFLGLLAVILTGLAVLAEVTR